ncbi:translocation/assembly module TamB domain-containing protein [Asticcacaulis sp. EMRT-3]|uniref:translocation/assembly module TamB domain-containing protein n=1 Tax=Asticcacaulis sp. EMRT-3 TaxID=3040349 RepID=UPI0024AFB6E4|nr:translocation/assembly module TamB domain-containing protein [Asticcacaulis sp. EMRT-3]MDI7775067.1 translocation/assembly module TamB domain-containing protein [Asticcacaulis sp. EMRT-3]
MAGRKKPPKAPLNLSDDRPEDTVPAPHTETPIEQAKEVAEKVARKAGFSLSDISWGVIARRVGLTIAAILVLLGVFLAALNTPPGRRLLVQLATGIKLNSGLQFQIDRIDGSLYGKMTLHGLKVLDTKGVFIEAPVVNLDWRPFGYLDKHVDIRDLDAPRIEVLRQPVLNPEPAQPAGPLLPDLRIDINRLQVADLAIDAPVTGQAYHLRIGGATHIVHGEARLLLEALSDKGDRLDLRLEAVPDADRLDIDAHARAPKDGVVDGLLHLRKPLSLDLSGKGSWKQWQGHLTTDFGTDTLADLGVTAQSGVFHIKGSTHPDRILSGESAALLEPQVTVDMIAKMQDRTFDLNGQLASQAMKVTALGVVDLAHNHFKKLEVHARLLRPDALGKDVNASDLHADLLFDGAFATPKIQYDITAKRFGLGGIALSGLDAQGQSHAESHADGTALIIPLKARLDSLTGINAQVDPLLMHLKLDGQLTFNGATLTSDTLHIRSDRVKATGTIMADLAAGKYTANAQASLNNYTVENLAKLNASSHVKLAYTHAGLAVNGTLTAQTTKILNDGLARALGGNAKISSGYAYAPNGVLAIRGLDLKAPKLSLQGNGTLATAGRNNGAILFKATAQSADYGPADLALSGTIDHPSGLLHAAHPGLGIGLANVTANFDATPDGFAVKGDGGSNYGPFTADTLIHTGSPLTIDIHHADFAGVGMTGTLTQNAAGPFEGMLALSGAGLNGTAKLAAINTAQGATLHAIGNQFDVPGNVPIHIGRAIIDATLLMQDQAKIDADVQMADVHYQNMVLSTGRAKVALIGQTGTIRAVANGASSGKNGVPLNIAVSADLSPGLYRVAAQGMANGIGFHTDAPARITQSGADWVLAPTTIKMDAGRLDIAGRFGAQKTAQLRLHDLDLSVANLFAGDLGVNGVANGAVDFTQSGDGLPSMHARLTVKDFSRSSAAVASAPVDLDLDARLDPDGQTQDNYAHALVRLNGAVIGRVRLNLTPGAGQDWTQRLQNGNLSGGVRYNGPAGVPFSLAGLPRQQLAGAVAVAADVSGQVASPQLNGVIKANNLTYDNEQLGTRITHIALDGRFTSDRLQLDSFSGQAGDGTVKASGWLSLAADQHFPMALHADLVNARLARSDAINSVVSGTLDVVNNPTDGPLIKGDLRLPQFKYQVVKQGAAEINVLDGVHRKGESLTPPADSGGAPSKWKLNVRIRADNKVFVSGMGLDSEWSADLRVGGTSDDPQVVGSMKAIRGDYSFAGRAFNLDSGTITFDGGDVTNPEIDLSASANLSDIQGIIKISGSAQRPQISFSSTPALPQDEVLSRMLFGESVANISPTEALQLAAAVNSLNGGGDKLNPLNALRSATGIDRLRVVSADAATGRGTSLAAGKYLTNNVYVEIVTDTKGFTATQFQIALGKALSILSQTGGVNGTSVSVRYSKDY